MSTAVTANADHQDHHDDPMSHVPPPSFWPLIVCIALTGLVFGSTFYFMAVRPDTVVRGGLESLVEPLGLPLLLLGLIGTMAGIMGWAHQIIAEKKLSHDPAQQAFDLKMFTKLFLVSELTAFLAIFAYYYIRRLLDPSFQAPAGLHLGGPLVAFATMMLLASSLTCEFAHHAMLHGEAGKARLLLLVTMALGVIFLGFQGYEYGLLINHGFNVDTSAYATLFYVATGFHGFHVLTGLVMLFLVYVRCELGHFSPQRHFAFVAASWYWHFVDIVWVLLFITIYVV